MRWRGGASKHVVRSLPPLPAVAAASTNCVAGLIDEWQIACFTWLWRIPRQGGAGRKIVELLASEAGAVNQDSVASVHTYGTVSDRGRLFQVGQGHMQTYIDLVSPHRLSLKLFLRDDVRPCATRYKTTGCPAQT